MRPVLVLPTYSVLDIDRCLCVWARKIRHVLVITDTMSGYCEYVMDTLSLCLLLVRRFRSRALAFPFCAPCQSRAVCVSFFRATAILFISPPWLCSTSCRLQVIAVVLHENIMNDRH